jgi:hypothetical protein
VGAMAAAVAAVVAAVAGEVEQRAAWPLSTCLDGRLAVSRALSVWVFYSEGRLAYIHTMRLFSVDVILIKSHRNILAYIYFSYLTARKNGSESLQQPDNESAFPKIQQKHSSSWSIHDTDDRVFASSRRVHNTKILDRCGTQQSARR